MAHFNIPLDSLPTAVIDDQVSRGDQYFLSDYLGGNREAKSQTLSFEVIETFICSSLSFKCSS